jgi:type I restriction enzyme, S subunit
VSELPKGWDLASLGDICEPSQYGYTAKAAAVGNIHFLRTTDITSGAINWESVPFCDVDDETKEKYRLRDGDVVISRAGSVGYSFLIRQPRPAVFASYLIRFRPKIDADYVRYFLQTPGYWRAISERSLGIAVQNVNASKLADLTVPVAPAAEQNRIVAKLEELLSDLDAGVAELKAAQEKLQQYRQSLLKAAVEGALTADWREAQRQQGTPTETGAQLLARILTERRARWQAKQLAKFKEQGKAPPKDWQKKYPEPVEPEAVDLPILPEGWVWANVDQLSPDDLANGRSVPTAERGAKVLRLTSIYDGLVDLKEVKGGDWTLDEAKPFAVKSGDLLIVRGNGSKNLVGRIGRVGSVTEQIAFPDTLIRLRVCDTVVSPSWVALVWDSRLVRAHIERRARTSAGIYKISQPDIVATRVPIPPVTEAREIIARLEAQFASLAMLEAAIAQSLEYAAVQRQKILQAAFAGNLVPQNSTDEPAHMLLERVRVTRGTVATPRRRVSRANT